VGDQVARSSFDASLLSCFCSADHDVRAVFTRYSVSPAQLCFSGVCRFYAVPEASLGDPKKLLFRLLGIYMARSFPGFAAGL
jgi:hypothetical protein